MAMSTVSNTRQHAWPIVDRRATNTGATNILAPLFQSSSYAARKVAKERSDKATVSKAMGFAALNPSYMTPRADQTLENRMTKAPPPSLPLVAGRTCARRFAARLRGITLHIAC